MSVDPSDPRPLLAFATTLVLALTAGCAGLGAGPAPAPADADESLTPAPVPEPDDRPFAPGLGPDGVRDAELLGRVHAGALERTGYTLVANRTARYENGSVHSRLRIRIAVTAGRAYLATVRTRGAGGAVRGRLPADATYWSDGDRYLRRIDHGEWLEYGAFEPIDGYAGTWAYWVREVALTGSAARDLAETVDAFDTRVVDRGRNRSRLLVGGGLRGSEFRDRRVTDPADATLTARVRPGGFVSAYRVRYATATAAGVPVRVSRSVRYGDVGSTTVDRPSWYDLAVEGVRTGDDEDDG